MADVTDSKPVTSGFSAALPFWLSLALVPIAWIGAACGGWILIAQPMLTWYLFWIIDSFVSLNETNMDAGTPDTQLFWYKLITWIWPPMQFVTLFGTLWLATQGHLDTGEMIAAFFGIAVLTGTIGINYSHELMHQRPRLERGLADFLLAMVLYSHFRSEHLLVHHRHVGTPKDPATARYDEGLYHYLPRVLYQSYVSAFRAETQKLDRKRLPWWHRTNPFWQYWASQLVLFALAYAIAGWTGVALFIFQAYVAIVQLELVNYIEHYGLTRRHLGDGKYERVRPHHSWNSAHKASNWLLINLQRHADHHYRPTRRFPLLQTYAEDKAPQLPHGYPGMALLALVPPFWRRVMNPRVWAWRRRHYSDIKEWEPYSRGLNPVRA